jgi:hypothetical protein
VARKYSVRNIIQHEIEEAVSRCIVRGFPPASQNNTMAITIRDIKAKLTSLKLQEKERK